MKVLEAVLSSKYRPQANEIRKALEVSNVLTWDAIDNAPRLIGSKVAGIDVYQFVATIRKYKNQDFEIMEEEDNGDNL